MVYDEDHPFTNLTTIVEDGLALPGVCEYSYSYDDDWWYNDDWWYDDDDDDDDFDGYKDCDVCANVDTAIVGGVSSTISFMFKLFDMYKKNAPPDFPKVPPIVFIYGDLVFGLISLVIASIMSDSLGSCAVDFVSVSTVISTFSEWGTYWSGAYKKYRLLKKTGSIEAPSDGKNEDDPLADCKEKLKEYMGDFLPDLGLEGSLEDL